MYMAGPGPKCAWRDEYITLDSRASADAGTDPRQGVYTWDLIPGGVTGVHGVGVSRPLVKVSEIQIGDFVMPDLPDDPYVQTGTGLTLAERVPYVPGVEPAGGWPAPPPAAYNPYKQLAHGGRITVHVAGTGTQVIRGYEGANHQFEMMAAGTPEGGEVGSQRMVLVDRSGTSSPCYRFDPPLPELTTLRLSFRSPDNPIAFGLDKFRAEVVLSGNSLVTADPRLLSTAEDALGIRIIMMSYLVGDNGGSPHQLQSGDRIYIRETATGYVALDTYLNRPGGHVVADHRGDYTTIGIDLIDTIGFDPVVKANVSNFIAIGPTLVWPMTVFVAKRRLRIPIRVRSVCPSPEQR
jgi:hypothetical protein